MKSKSSNMIAGIALIAGSCIVAAVACVLGLMFISFAGGVKAGSNIPGWYNTAMLLLWPMAMGAVALVPGMLLLGGASWHWPVRIALGGGLLCLVWWMAGTGLMMSYGSRPTNAGPVSTPFVPPMHPKTEFANKFSITHDECAKLGLAPVAFALSWSNAVTRVAPEENRDAYIILRLVSEDGKPVEELTIGSAAGINEPHDNTSGNTHPQNAFVDELHQQMQLSLGLDYDIQLRHSNWSNLHGRHIHAELTDPASSNANRPISMLQFVFVPPSPRVHGLLISMRAFESSSVEECQDFHRTGMPQKVLQSFHWLQQDNSS